MSETNQEFADRMKSTYSELFNHDSISFSVVDGWRHLIENLLEGIASHLRWLEMENIKPPPFNVSQIKEKFGSLRFYYRGGDAVISGMVTITENLSGNMCVVCGAPTKLMTTGYVRPLCKQHYDESMKRI